MASKKKLLDGLNHDLNEELSTVLRYVAEASVVKGLQGHEARELFLVEAADELKHAAFLADKIVALGGKPEVKPAYPTLIENPVQALKREYEHELQAVNDYKGRCKQADEAGEIGLRVELENMIADETRHAEDLQRLLR